MEELNKRYRIQHAAITLFTKQGIEATSVNEIVKEANVAKGTFYVYYKDKKELISQILILKHGDMLNDIMNYALELATASQIKWVPTFIEELLYFYQENPAVLEMIQKNITMIFDTHEHRNLVFSHILHLDNFLQCLHHEGESERETMNRFMIAMEVIGTMSYNAMFYEMPDSMEHMQSQIIEIAKTICS